MMHHTDETQYIEDEILMTGLDDSEHETDGLFLNLVFGLEVLSEAVKQSEAPVLEPLNVTPTISEKPPVAMIDTAPDHYRGPESIDAETCQYTIHPLPAVFAEPAPVPRVNNDNDKGSDDDDNDKGSDDEDDTDEDQGMTRVRKKRAKNGGPRKVINKNINGTQRKSYKYYKAGMSELQQKCTRLASRNAEVEKQNQEVRQANAELQTKNIQLDQTVQNQDAHIRQLLEIIGRRNDEHVEHS
jgi:hypothetical protein